MLESERAAILVYWAIAGDIPKHQSATGPLYTCMVYGCIYLIK